MKFFSVSLLTCCLLVVSAGAETKLLFGPANTPEQSRTIAGFELVAPEDLQLLAGPGGKTVPWLYGDSTGSEPADRLLEHGLIFFNLGYPLDWRDRYM